MTTSEEEWSRRMPGPAPFPMAGPRDQPPLLPLSSSPTRKDARPPPHVHDLSHV